MSDDRRIVDDLLYVHFDTFSVDGRRRLLDHEHGKRIVPGVLNDLLERMEARCVGFVLMPEHVHAVVWISRAGRLSEFVKEWKRRSSLEIRRWATQEFPGYLETWRQKDRFWQPKYDAFEIDREAKLVEKLQYIHLNPVRRGLVARATDWRWSSARWYEQRRTGGVPITWVGE